MAHSMLVMLTQISLNSLCEKKKRKGKIHFELAMNYVKDFQDGLKESSKQL